MPAEAANQAVVLDMAARLAAAVQVAPAARAHSFLVHVGRVVPAPLALRVAARFHLDRGISPMDARGRRQQQELELLPEAREPLVVAAARVVVDLGLQRRAKLALRAQRL